MKKIFRLAKAELSKIFMRPSMIILTTILVVTLILSFILFSPTSVNTKFTYDATDTYKIYTSFENDYKKLEQELLNEKSKIDNFIDPMNDVYMEFSTRLQSTYVFYYGDFKLSVQNMSKSYVSQSEITECKNAFKKLRDDITILKNFLPTKLETTPINFYITSNDYESLNKFLVDMYSSLPSDTDFDKFTVIQIIERSNSLFKNFDLKKIKQQFSSYDKIELKSEDLTNLLDKYLYSNIIINDNSFTHTGRLEELYNNVIDYYKQIGSTKEEKILTELNTRVAQFNDYVNICKTLISNNFELLRIGYKTDDQIIKYQGFTNTSKYNLQKQIATSKYFFENNTFGYEYLNAFNFGINSGIETNAYDFTFFSMQLLSLLITVFAIYFASSLINGEQNTGTLKMAATRPYTRNKIYSGKFLACVNVSLILLLVSFIASFVVGIASFGFTTQQVLVVMNASEVIVMHPLLLMGIYFVSILIDIIFYISLAILISMLIKPTTINTATSTAILIVSTILFGTIKDGWTRFIPSMHLGLYKFFTNSVTGMFSFSVVPNFNMITSLIIVFVSILIFDLLNRFLFTHRSIDK